MKSLHFFSGLHALGEGPSQEYQTLSRDQNPAAFAPVALKA